VERRLSFLGTLTVLVLAFVPAAASSSRLPELLESHPCFVAIERRLESWGATDEILKGPSGPLGGDVYRIATKEIGVWVTLHLARSEATASLFLTDGEGSTRLDFGASCSPARRLGAAQCHIAGDEAGSGSRVAQPSEPVLGRIEEKMDSDP